MTQDDTRTTPIYVVLASMRICGNGLNRLVELGYIDFTVEIQVKEGRYKFSFHTLRHKIPPFGYQIVSPGILTTEKPGGGISSMGLKNWNYIKEYAHKDFTELVQSLKDYMAKPSDRSSDDW